MAFPIRGTGAAGGPSLLDMRDFEQNSHSFQRMVGYDAWRKNVSFGNFAEPEQMRVGLVPAAYFETLKVQPTMGRLFTDEENHEGKHYVAAINVRLWRERFARDKAILGPRLRSGLLLASPVWCRKAPEEHGATTNLHG